MAASKDFEIVKGKTFQHSLRWEAAPYVYKPITAITKAAPVSITCPSHGLVDGWRVAVVSVKGMVELNAELDDSKLPVEAAYQRVTVVDANTVELNQINSSDFTAYSSGGYLQFLTPVDLTGYTARMTIKDRVGGVTIASLTTENGGITIDTAAKKINLLLSASATAAITQKKGVYDLEMQSSGGVVTGLISGAITIESEVTT